MPRATPLREFLHGDDGVTAIEYALMGSLIAVVIVGAVTLLGIRVEALFDLVSTAVAAAAAG